MLPPTTALSPSRSTTVSCPVSILVYTKPPAANEFVRYHFPPLQGQEEIELKTFRWFLRNSSWSRLEASATPLQGPDFECGGAKW